MLRFVSGQLCTRCGRPLRNGVCPLGHPQRAARRPRRRPWRGIVLFVLVIVLLAGAAYGALVWYPPKAAGDAVAEPSERFADVLPVFEQTVAAYPEGGDEESLAGVSDILTDADETRTRLTALQLRLEDASVVSLPVVSDRPAVQLAERALSRMETFTTSAQDLMADIEVTSRYLTELANILPTLDNLRAAVGNPAGAGGVEGAVAASTPIAEQLTADLRILSPPEELSPTHASLLAIARSIRTTIGELDEAGQGGQAAAPVIKALVGDIRAQLDAFREAAIVAPDDALAAGLADQIGAVEDRAAAIVVDLRDLREQGVEGITVPEA